MTCKVKLRERHSARPLHPAPLSEFSVGCREDENATPRRKTDVAQKCDNSDMVFGVAHPRLKSKTESQLRREICRIGRWMYTRGYVVASEGNLSARLDGDQILVTPA